MPIDDKQLQSILVAENYVTEEEMKKAVEHAKKQRVSLQQELIMKQLVTNDLIGQAYAESLGISYADLNSKQASKEQVVRIPEEIAKKYRVVLFDEKEKEIIFATDNPKQKGLVAGLKTIAKKKKVSIAYSLSEDIDQAFLYYRKSLETKFGAILEQESHVASQLIDAILEDAFILHASDIHLEPQGVEILVRFRIDGVLQEAGEIPKDIYENILNRIKVMGHMRIDEHFSAQDGAIRYKSALHNADLRVSIAPTLGGEKIVIRVLSQYVQTFRLANLGLSNKNEDMLLAATAKPFGMILVVGPTGSGKTTTLYGVLKLLNKPEVNITTIEDPVEYRIKEVNQIQVNKEKDLTFAKGLRSIVRQDPDIILVGEIRDDVTADIAVNAALTGHLLLSTFHANDSATAIPRLLDMGIEPFLLASTLEVIVAQRLVRTIHDQCKESYTMTAQEIKKLHPESASFFPKKENFYRGKGCEICNGTGYSGRTAIFEFLEMTKEIKELILTNPSTQEIWKLAKKQGTTSLFEDGIEKVKKGETTIEELLRVAMPSNRN